MYVHTFLFVQLSYFPMYSYMYLHTYIYIYMCVYIYIYIVCIYIYPPTPALAKAGAAPGTTGGVEPGLSRPWPSPCPSLFQPAGPPQADPRQLFRYTPAAKDQGHVLLKAFKPAVCPPSNPLNASAGLSKANLAPRRPIQGNSSAKHYRPNTRAICF